jgi:hypothetical protein
MVIAFVHSQFPGYLLSAALRNLPAIQASQMPLTIEPATNKG